MKHFLFYLVTVMFFATMSSCVVVPDGPSVPPVVTGEVVIHTPVVFPRYRHHRHYRHRVYHRPWVERRYHKRFRHNRHNKRMHKRRSW